MTEQERQEWNEVATAARENPGDAVAVARRDALRTRILTQLAYKFMEEDDYQVARTGALDSSQVMGVASLL